MFPRLRHGLAVLLLLPTLAACDPGGLVAPVATPVVAPTPLPTATPEPPPAAATPTVLTPDAIQADLQTVVDTERRAVLGKSQDAFMNVIDHGDRDWYKFEEDEFANDSYLTERLDCVSNIRIGPNGATAQADVALDSCPGRYKVGMFFRLVAGHWLHSQPGLDEQGPRATKKIGPFRVTYHEMEEPYLATLAHFAPAVYERVSSVLNMKQLDVDVDLLSRPTDMPRGAFTTIALYNPINARMSMLSPRFWPNGDGTEEALDDQVRTTLTHEFTHHAVRTAALLHVPHWFNEGMAVYISQENPTRYVRDNQQLALSGKLQPPEALNALLQDGDAAEISYAEGYGFVHYLTAKQGDTVLAPLLLALNESGDLNAALKTVTGKGLSPWWQAWTASLKE